MGRLNWLRARVVQVRAETPLARSLLLDVPGWPGHRPGQHVEVRLTAEDGYQAQRSYSIASAPGAGLLMLTVQQLEGGEVSPYLTAEARPGDVLELRGPIGGHFVWDGGGLQPLLLLAGGAGMVPLMSMLRHRAALGGPAPAALLYSCRRAADILYREELLELAGAVGGPRVRFALTRDPQGEPADFHRRVDAAMLAAVGLPPADRPLAYICGGSGFVEAAAEGLLRLGHPAERIRTERFGPSGG